jgi:hypothetical protein
MMRKMSIMTSLMTMMTRIHAMSILSKARLDNDVGGYACKASIDNANGINEVVDVSVHDDDDYDDGPNADIRMCTYLKRLW